MRGCKLLVTGFWLSIILGCSFLGLGGGKPWADKKSGPYFYSTEEIWAVVRKAIGPLYEIKTLDTKKRILETEWNTLPGVSRYEGMRTKIHIKLIPYSDVPRGLKNGHQKNEEKGYFIEVKAELERNKDLSSFAHPETIEWESDGTDPDEASRIMERIHILLLKPPEIRPRQ